MIAEVEIFNGEKTFWLDKQIFSAFEGTFSLSLTAALNYINNYIQNYDDLVNYSVTPHYMWVEQEYYNYFICQP